MLVTAIQWKLAIAWKVFSFSGAFNHPANLIWLFMNESQVRMSQLFVEVGEIIQ